MWLLIFSEPNRTMIVLNPLINMHRKNLKSTFEHVLKPTGNSIKRDDRILRKICLKVNIHLIFASSSLIILPILLLICIIADFYLGFYNWTICCSIGFIIKKIFLDIICLMQATYLILFICTSMQYIHVTNAWFELNYREILFRFKHFKHQFPEGFNQSLFLRKLGIVNSQIMKLSKEASPMILTFHSTMLFMLNMLIILMINPNSKALVRFVITIILIMIFGFSTILFISLARLNQLSRIFLPIIRHYYLHNQIFIQIHLTKSVTKKWKRLYQKNLPFQYRWKAMELESQINENRIGFDCGKRFVITRLTNLMAIISSVLNLIMLMNLFQNYLFKEK